MHKGSFVGDRNILKLDWGDVCPILKRAAFMVCKLFLNKTVKREDYSEISPASPYPSGALCLHKHESEFLLKFCTLAALLPKNLGQMYLRNYRLCSLSPLDPPSCSSI